MHPATMLWTQNVKNSTNPLVSRCYATNGTHGRGADQGDGASWVARGTCSASIPEFLIYVAALVMSAFVRGISKWFILESRLPVWQS